MKNTLNANQLGLFVRLESKPGKENEIENFLKKSLELVENEADTSLWFAIRLGPSSFGIFDTFPNETGRQTHLSGKVAETLFAKAPELFAKSPLVETFETIACKL
ncbi:MAG: antibiotic biosynthesis monooxygenase [Tatlockia sp.]|nr:antibiotic biosynthesis monooxygenase [Tatlockia sp.]